MIKESLLSIYIPLSFPLSEPSLTLTASPCITNAPLHRYSLIKQAHLLNHNFGHYLESKVINKR